MSANKRELIMNLRLKTIKLENDIRKVNPQKQITELLLLLIQLFVGIGMLITFVYLIYSNERIPDTIIYLSGPILLLLVLWIYDSLKKFKINLIRYMQAKYIFNNAVQDLEEAKNLIGQSISRINYYNRQQNTY